MYIQFRRLCGLELHRNRVVSSQNVWRYIRSVCLSSICQTLLSQHKYIDAWRIWFIKTQPGWCTAPGALFVLNARTVYCIQIRCNRALFATGARARPPYVGHNMLYNIFTMPLREDKYNINKPMRGDRTYKSPVWHIIGTTRRNFCQEHATQEEHIKQLMHKTCLSVHAFTSFRDLLSVCAFRRHALAGTEAAAASHRYFPGPGPGGKGLRNYGNACVVYKRVRSAG